MSHESASSSADSLNRFVGKVAIVTGSSSGLGAAVALRLARERAQVTLTGRDENKLKAVVANYQKGTASEVNQEDVAKRFLLVVGDVTQAEVRKEIVEKTIATFGRLDILINNAGVFLQQADLNNATEETFDQIMSTNVKAHFFMIQLAAPHLEKNKGNVVMVSSCLSVMCWPQALLYNVSKAAIDHMTRNLALALAPRGVRINCVNPAYIATHSIRNWSPSPELVDQTAQGFAANMGPLQPMHGKCATPDEFADTVLYLLSDAAKFITGQALLTDGGISLVGAYSNIPL